MDERIVYVSSGHFTSEGTWQHPARQNDTTELILVLHGRVPLTIDGAPYLLDEGMVCRLDPGVRHSGTFGTDAPVSFYWLHYRREPATAENGFPMLCHPASSPRLSVLFRILLHYAGGDYPPAARDAAARLIVEELRADTAAVSAGGTLYHGICEWCRIHRHTPLTAEQIASHFGYHPDYLTRYFRSVCGMGLKEYMIGLRMEYLRSLLLSTDLPLKEIASRGGFEDERAFLKFFRYHAGMTPTEFRDAFPATHTNNR